MSSLVSLKRKFETAASVDIFDKACPFEEIRDEISDQLDESAVKEILRPPDQ